MQLTHNEALVVQRAAFKLALSLVGPKRRDYSGTADPFANLRTAELAGVEPWRGALVRLLDKLSRLRRLAEAGGRGAVSDESLLDTAADALNYVCIALGLIVETLPEANAQALLGTARSLDASLRWPPEAP